MDPESTSPATASPASSPAAAQTAGQLDDVGPQDVSGAVPGLAIASQAPTPPTTRRRFLRYLLGFSIVSTAAMVFGPVVAFLVPPVSSSTGGGGKVLAGTLEDIPLGSGKVVPVGSKPTIVVHTEQGVTAYSAICTHLGCIVAFDDGNQTIVCPCHDGRFNPGSGAVISGPPPGPLAPAEVSVEGDEIYLVEG